MTQPGNLSLFLMTLTGPRNELLWQGWVRKKRDEGSLKTGLGVGSRDEAAVENFEPWALPDAGEKLLPVDISHPGVKDAKCLH